MALEIDEIQRFERTLFRKGVSLIVYTKYGLAIIFLLGVASNYATKSFIPNLIGSLVFLTNALVPGYLLKKEKEISKRMAASIIFIDLLIILCFFLFGYL